VAFFRKFFFFSFDESVFCFFSFFSGLVPIAECRLALSSPGPPVRRAGKPPYWNQVGMGQWEKWPRPVLGGIHSPPWDEGVVFFYFVQEGRKM